MVLTVRVVAVVAGRERSNGAAEDAARNADEVTVGTLDVTGRLCVLFTCCITAAVNDLLVELVAA